jgi:hypothetical protein
MSERSYSSLPGSSRRMPLSPVNLNHDDGSVQGSPSRTAVSEVRGLVNRKSKFRSPVWKFFDLTKENNENPNRAKCRICR